MAALTLFYSYAHEDAMLRDQLEKHLVPLQREGLISTWHDRKILPGSMRADEMDRHLETASVILLLVSPDFLASNYCYEIEMQRALERHRLGLARIVPIILRPCDWQHSPLKELQCLPREGLPVTQWRDPDEVFQRITQDLRQMIEQQARHFVPLTPLHRQNRTRMLKQVRKIWIDGVLTQSLHHAARIELHLQDRPDVLANPWRLQVQETDQAPKNLPDETTIVQVYDRADGELLILGEPGAGKTTLLLELAHTLIARAEHDERLPMPIVFHLSSWAKKRQPLHAWLVEELRTKYQIPRKIAQGWIDTDQVLPLLDGLDEVAKDARSACVKQINEYYQAKLERGSGPIVVCCRSEEYAALSTRVMLQHAVSILPLTDSQINTYLEQVGEQIRGLRQALDKDTELHNLARQPLMLNIFTLAYQGAQVGDVPTGQTHEEMRHTIFAKYVERMLRRREQSKRWMPEQVAHWLAFLAKQMQQHGQTVFVVESLQATWLSKRWRTLHQWCVGLIFGLLCGLIFVRYGLIFELIFGLLCGLSFGSLVGSLINPTEVLIWSWKGARLGLLFGLIAGLLGGSIVGLSSGLTSGLLSGLFFGLFFGSIVGLFFGLSGQSLQSLGGNRRISLNLLSLKDLETVSNFNQFSPKGWRPSGQRLREDRLLSPNEGIWRSGKNGLLIGLIVGLPFGLLFGLVSGLTSGLLMMLLAVLFVGIAFELRAFVMHFILRFFLSLQGDLPWNLIAFLDEAAERLLLRKVGGSYIFVHRMLLDYFAELEEKDGSHRHE